MELGMIGLGRMGANMSERVAKAGHRVVGYDPDPKAVASLAARGAEGAASVDALVKALAPPRAVWMMVPAGDAVQATLDTLLGVLSPGDVVIDGGNSNYNESKAHAAQAADAGIHFLDVGVSGGVWGLKEGYSLMIGGAEEAVARLRPVFEALAPAPDRGWAHVGPSGSGHFVKMVHNGIEYGAMQAFAEGFALMRAKEEFGLDLHQVAEVWRHGSVVRSWLLDLTARALEDDPSLADLAPYVPDSGEGRWTVQECVDLAVPAPVMTMALMTRFRSRDEYSYADRLLSALRNQFGGHAVKKAEDQR